MSADSRDEDLMDATACLNARSYLSKIEQEVLDDLYSIPLAQSFQQSNLPAVSSPSKPTGQHQKACLDKGEIEDGEITDDDVATDTSNTTAGPFSIAGHPLNRCSVCSEGGHSAENCGFATGKFCLLCRSKLHGESNCPMRSDRRSGKDDRKRCRQCGELGHVQSQCHDLRRCYICRKSSHISRDCPKLTALNSDQSPGRNARKNRRKRRRSRRSSSRDSTQKSDAVGQARQRMGSTERNAKRDSESGNRPLTTLDRLNMVDIDSVAAQSSVAVSV